MADMRRGKSRDRERKGETEGKSFRKMSWQLTKETVKSRSPLYRTLALSPTICCGHHAEIGILGSRLEVRLLLPTDHIEELGEG